MKKMIIIMLVFISALFANVTVYTENRYYKTTDNEGNTISETDTVLEDRSKFTFNDSCTMFIHNTNTGTVPESTYWIEPGSLFTLDEGFSCIATSDAGNEYQFIFTTELVIIILESYEESKDVLLLKVKNIIK